MNYLFKLILGCIMSYGLTYAFVYKPNDDKMHCKVCNDTHFVVSKKLSKFVGDMNNRVISTGIFYKCAKCGALTDVKVN